MKKTLKILIISTSAVAVSACSTPGPMQTMYGPMNTPVFEPVALDTVKDGSSKVYFKEWTTMYENKEIKLWGVFFITENGAYMASWDTQSYEYNLKYKINKDDVELVSDDTVARSFWPDSDLLIIKDKLGNEVGFALNGKGAARSFLNEISGK